MRKRKIKKPASSTLARGKKMMAVSSNKLKGFLLSEDGKMDKKKAAKIGAATIAALLLESQRSHDAVAHSNYFDNNQPGNTGSHYSQHSDGGWC